MEVLAIGLLGLAGKYISDRFVNNTDDNYIDNNVEDDDTIENDKEYTVQNTYATTANGFDQKRRVLDTMDNVTYEKKKASENPHSKNIVPPLFNKRVYDLDTENKYLSAAHGKQFEDTRGPSMLDIYKSDRNLMEGPVNTLTTLDEQFSPIMINKQEKPVPENQGKLTLPSNWTPFKGGEDNDMTYGIFNKDELIHNNMQPFFKDRGMLITQDNSRNLEQTLDIYTGSSRFYFQKKEVPNIVENFEGGFSTAYQPIPQLSYTRGTPVQIDLVKDRYFSGKEKKNDLPFDQVRVGPGLNIGAYEEGKSGFQDPFQPANKTIDQLRRLDNPQISSTQPTMPGARGFGKSAIIGDVVNKKPVTYGTLGKDYEVQQTFSNVKGPTDKGNFNFDKARRGKEEVVEQGPMSSNNNEKIPDIFNFGKIKETFKRLMPGFVQSLMTSDVKIPVLDKSSYNNSVTQRSTANSVYTAGMSAGNGAHAGEVSEYQSMATNRINTQDNFTGSMGTAGGGAGEVSEYQFTTTQRFNTNANFTGSMKSNGGVGEMSEYQNTPTQRFNTNANFTGSMTSGGGMGGVGEMSEYQNTPTQRFNMNTNTSGGLGTANVGGVGDMSTYQFTPTQRFNTNTNFTGSMTSGGGMGGVGEMSEYQNTPTQRFNMNTNFTGSMATAGGGGAGETSEYQFTPTQRFNQNSSFTGAVGNNTGGVGEVSEYQFTPTQRFNQNSNFTGSVGNNTGGNGEVSEYQFTPTNRFSQNTNFTGGMGGGAEVSEMSKYQPMATNRIVSNNLTGGMGLSGVAGMGGYLAETTQNVPTYRQTQNFDYAGPIQTANGTEMTSTGEAERNMYFRDDKENLLRRLEPTPVNAFQGPTPESMYSMHLKDLPNVMMMQGGSSNSTDYLPFYSKLKNIQIPTTYPNFDPALMLQGNPYVNNVALQSVPNIQNPTVGYAGVNTGEFPNSNTNGVFFQMSQDQLTNNY